MKVGILLFLFVVGTIGLNAQSIDTDEKKLIEEFEQILVLKFKYDSVIMNSADPLPFADSLIKANESYISHLLNVLTKVPSFVYQFNKLKKATDIRFIQSPDKTSRLISWDTYTGGTMSQNAVIIQYIDIEGKVRSEIINSAGLFFGTKQFVNGSNVIFEKIYQIKCKNGSVNVAIGKGICEKSCISNTVLLYQISNKGLSYPRKIRFKNDSVNSLTFSYQLYDMEIKWDPKFIVNEKNNTILVPFIQKDRPVKQKKYRTYSIW